MKKVLALIIMLFAIVTVNAQCPAPTVVSAQAKGQHKFIIKVANPAPKHFFNLEWSNTGQAPWTLVKCTGTWNDREGVVEIGIHNTALPGYTYYNIQNGAVVRIYQHCNPAISYQDCFNDNNLSTPTAPIPVTFH